MNIRKISFLVPLMVLAGTCFGFLLSPNDPFRVDMSHRLEPISATYPLGTDILGRCTLSRLLYGGRITIGIVVLGCLLVLCFGTVIGLLISKTKDHKSLFYESVLNSITAIPPIAYLIIFIGAWGNGVFTMTIAITLSLLLRLIKLVKTRTEVELKKAYIYCAMTSGAGRIRLLFWHVLPNILTDVVEFVCLSCADMVLAIVGFSFIGLGLGDNVVDWGTMVSESYHLFQINPWLTYYPVICIFISTLCFHILGRHISSGGHENA